MNKCWNYSEQICPIRAACHYPMQCALTEHTKGNDMPRLSKFEEFKVAVKARLTTMRCGTTLSVLDEIIILGCFHRNKETRDGVDRAREAACYIHALHMLKI